MGALVEAIKFCHSLRTLNLEFNRLGDSGVSAIASAFARGLRPELTSLSLAHNDVGDTGLLRLAHALSNGALPKLSTLSLAGNPRIRDDGLDALGRAIASVRELRTLKLFSCGACHEARERLRGAFRHVTF